MRDPSRDYWTKEHSSSQVELADWFIWNNLKTNYLIFSFQWKNFITFYVKLIEERQMIQIYLNLWVCEKLLKININFRLLQIQDGAHIFYKEIDVMPQTL